MEMLLDSVLIEQHPEALPRFYDAMDSIDPYKVQAAVNQCARQPTERLALLIPRFNAERFLFDYATLRRPRVPAQSGAQASEADAAGRLSNHRDFRRPDRRSRPPQRPSPAGPVLRRRSDHWIGVRRFRMMPDPQPICIGNSARTVLTGYARHEIRHEPAALDRPPSTIRSRRCSRRSRAGATTASSCRSSTSTRPELRGRRQAARRRWASSATAVTICTDDDNPISPDADDPQGRARPAQEGHRHVRRRRRDAPLRADPLGPRRLHRPGPDGRRMEMGQGDRSPRRPSTPSRTTSRSSSSTSTASSATS